MEVEPSIFANARIAPFGHTANLDMVSANPSCGNSFFDGGTAKAIPGRRRSDCDDYQRRDTYGCREACNQRKRALSFEKMARKPLMAGNEPEFRKEPIPLPTDRVALPRRLSFLSQMIRASSDTSLSEHSSIGDVVRLCVFVEGELHTIPVEIEVSKDSTIEMVLSNTLNKYNMERRIPSLDTRKLSRYCLRVAEEDGSIDTDFPVLARSQSIENFTHIRQFVLCVGQHYDVPSPKRVLSPHLQANQRQSTPLKEKFTEQDTQSALMNMEQRWANGMALQSTKSSPMPTTPSHMFKKYITRLCLGSNIAASPP